MKTAIARRIVLLSDFLHFSDGRGRVSFEACQRILGFVDTDPNTTTTTLLRLERWLGTLGIVFRREVPETKFGPGRWPIVLDRARVAALVERETPAALAFLRGLELRKARRELCRRRLRTA